MACRTGVDARRLWNPRSCGALLFADTLPWMVAGFWNAVIGFIIIRLSADPVTSVLPAAGLIRDDETVTASTAVLICVRNELPSRIIRNLEPMLEGI